jgi:hypothetical protein
VGEREALPEALADLARRQYHDADHEHHGRRRSSNADLRIGTAPPGPQAAQVRRRPGPHPWRLAKLAAFIEAALGDPEHPLARDLTEAADVEGIAAQWSWVQQAKATWKLGPMTNPPPIPPPARGLSPSRYGYELAAIVRHRAGLALAAPVDSIEDVARALIGGSFRVQNENHLPGQGVRAVVGWTSKSEVVVAGPRPLREDNDRFLTARAVFHALFACDHSERLVTRAYTWEQQASRAFAAEFLAPQAALTARSTGSTDRARVDELAREFRASAQVIENQLKNASATVFDE